MIGLIAAVSQNGVVGNANNEIPWSYPEDLKYFKQQTLNSTIIMGRATYESMGSRPLSKRTNIVISSKEIEKKDNLCRSKSLYKSILASSMEPNSGKNTWLIGGTNIWREGMKYADTIQLTLIPEVIEGDNLTYFPWIDPKQFELSIITPMPSEFGESKLSIAIYNRCPDF